VKGCVLIAIQPRPALWALVLVVHSGPDGIRVPMSMSYSRDFVKLRGGPSDLLPAT
jgi:hypothetical protein